MTENNMLPDLQSSLLCDDVRQERNGKFMLIGLFDGLSVPQYPAVFQKLCLVNRWCCGQGEFIQESRIMGTDGVTVLAQGKQVAIRLPHDRATATSVEIFLNVKLETPGTYWVEVILEESMRIRYPLQAREVKQKSQ
ncbi:MAG: hypothetical protein HN919_00635 [Verrucomicrobia bacterium]|jgi:hypothetical protein|nr:hypothetical protein [Verrucomicrobiota bacterium]MBT7064784.1 hypothetical protein [Verrucomicrobiota bacterium]MBT7700570.1 hypothetical protein [Verrucomicrobiota bacterium]